MNESVYRTVQISDQQRVLLTQAAKKYWMRPAAFARYALAYVVERIDEGSLDINQLIEFNSFAEADETAGRKRTRGLSLTYRTQHIVVIERVQAMIPFFRKEFSMLQRSAIGYVIQQLESGNLEISELRGMTKYDTQFPNHLLQNRSKLGFGLAYIVLYDTILRMGSRCKQYYCYTRSPRPVSRP